ncbi:MAG TPA: glycoside hydrolase family 3 C-terminal domain-containing protein, partial [Bacilli bacterium]|nr:glycoside hydrolase family 3 C-terminal domain-containing protein [Bacilli bacterium]
FEYFSEDPYLTGRLATTLVKAIQAQGVGTSLKHFAVNNQEEKRLMMNAIVDERALFEIYLRAFEMVIKDAKPTTLMCSYNQVNGLHASRNPYLLKEVLREKWGYQGLVVSDWGAVVELTDSVKAGLNLEMPGRYFSSSKLSKQLLAAGVKEKTIDDAVRPIIKLMSDKKTITRVSGNTLNYGDHHNLAVKVATEAAVLLKNENQLLPLNKLQSIAIIGNFAKNPRYQGSGSSRINPTMLENVFDAFTGHGVEFAYADGYNSKQLLSDDFHLEEATKVAKDKDAVILMVGLPDEFEMEGMDRAHLNLPESHVRLIEEVSKVNANVIVVLSAGSAVSMPWLAKVKSVLHMHLAGQGSGEAIYQLVYGEANPSGKLSETYPLKLEDVPSYNYFGHNKLNAEYRESIYVGYRYYQKAEKPVLFPFGFGLSYTTFLLKDIEVSETSFENSETISVRVSLKNTGSVAGAEVVQLYIGSRKQVVFQAPKVLRNFKKIWLNPGEENIVEFIITKDDFAIYDVVSKSFKAENGTYKVYVGVSSADSKLSRMIKVDTDFEMEDLSKVIPSYYHLKNEVLDISFAEYSELFPGRIKHYNAPTVRPFSDNNCLNDTKLTRVGRFITKKVSGMIKDMAKGDPLTETVMLKSFLDTPIRAYTAFSGGRISKRQVKGLVNILNLSFLVGVFRLIPTYSQSRKIKNGKKSKEKGN